ncbi:MAG: hypothetical protein C0483_08730 [Pirellula sp.]|nr:hypothetical protein [Pirellula sp.]
MSDATHKPTPGLNGPQTAAAVAAIFVVAAVAWWARFYFAAPASPAKVPQPGTVASTEPAVAPIDREALRRRAWSAIQPRLDAADQAAQAALDEQLRGVEEFFEHREAGVKPFAEAVLSLRGKWEFAKSKLPTADDDAHLRYLNTKFEDHVFKIDDLKQTVEHAVGGFVSRVQGVEGKLLVDVRADLSDGEFAAAGLPKFLLNDETFRAEFDRAVAGAAAEVAADFQIAVSREVVSFVAGEVAAQVAVRVATAVAARLGVSAGVLGTGAAAGWATFGLGLVAAVVVDVAISHVAKMAGYDPVARVSERVEAVLRDVRSLLIDGNPEARALYEQMRQMEATDPDPEVRKACRDSVAKVGAGDELGLRNELRKLHEVRARLRREALRRLVLEPSPEI